MANLDNRRLRLGIEIRGQIKYFEDLYIYASGAKYGCGIMNESDIRVTNLNTADRDWLMTAVSPYNLNRTPKKVIVEAGRVSKGLTRIFVGDIIRAEISQPPDITISMKARTSSFASGDIVAVSTGPTANLSAIAQQVADSMGLSLNFSAKDKLISNYAFTGGTVQQVDNLASAGNVNAYIDDLTLVVKDYGAALPGNLLFLSEETGMIGMPQLDPQGLTIKFLLDAKPVLGGAIDVKSKLYPACNGRYTIYKLDFEIANRDTPFYWTARASRPGMGI